jgi:cytoskeleton protein RodZ
MFEIGPALREARERRGLAYGQVEADTAIRSRYLKALEDEQFGILPGPTYAKGFLRAYAEYLGLDGQLFIDEFNSRHHDPRREFEQSIYSKPRSQPLQRRRQRRESSLVMIVLATIVAISALVFISFTYDNHRAQNNVPLGTTLSTTTPPPPHTGSPDTRTTSTKRTARHGGRFTVALVATAPCWIQLHVGSTGGAAALSTGHTSLGGYTIDPATSGTITVRSTKPLYLSDIGAASSLSLRIDGRTVALPTGTTQQSVLRITRSGVVKLP